MRLVRKGICKLRLRAPALKESHGDSLSRMEANASARKKEGCAAAFADAIRKEKAMFRMWGKIWKDNHLQRDTVIVNEDEDTRTHKVFAALYEICCEFDLGKPIWLESCIHDFQHHARCRFYQDSFMEPIDFDYLEIQMLEEDE